MEPQAVHSFGVLGVSALALVLAGTPLPATATPDKLAEPALTIPYCPKPPTVDGTLAPGEWDRAAAITMLEAYPSGAPHTVRKEQAVFYVAWDETNLYVAMDSPESSTIDGVVAKCATHDLLGICGDDELELMVAPGAGEAINQPDFPTYYLVVNSLDTVWDCKMLPLRNETHNTWESNVQRASTVHGAHWVCELRLPLVSMTRTLPQPGAVWRMNFLRTYYSYKYAGWYAFGNINSPFSAGNVTFGKDTAVVRLLSVEPFLAGKAGARLEVVNPASQPQTVTLRMTCDGQAAKTSAWARVAAAEQTVTVPPGGTVPVTLGGGEPLQAENFVALSAADPSGRTLFSMEHVVSSPILSMVKKPAPRIPLVSIVPRFLPSLERLAVRVDYTAWAKKTGYAGEPLRAEVTVWKKAEEGGKPLMEGVLSEFRSNRGTWRGSTKDLAEGDYVVKVRVLSVGKGEVLAEHDDWFEKRVFDWMVHPRGVGEDVPAPCEPLRAAGNTVESWGRSYAFTPAGLPAGVVSQGRQVLTGPVTLQAEKGGVALPLKVTAPFAVTEKKPATVRGVAVLAGGNLQVRIESVTEYDGFTLFRVTYGPESGTVALDRMRVRVPIAAKHALFYSAAGDVMGQTVQADLLPARQGLIYDSLNTTRSVCCSPTFATLFWVADHDICFCYAADNPAKQFGQIPMVGLNSWTKDPAQLARETRCMMMLAMLNDHDIGGYRKRDPEVLGALRKARNRFKPWEPEVTFAGYWENADLVKSSDTNVTVSLYRRPDSLLVVIGNASQGPAETTLRLNWKALGLDPRRLALTDAETGDALPVRNLTKGFTIEVKRHDLRLALVAPTGTPAGNQ